MVTKSDDSVPRSSFSQLQSPRYLLGWKWMLVISAIFISKFLFALQITILIDLSRGSLEELTLMQKLSWQHFASLIGAASASLVVGVSFGGVTYLRNSALINASLCALGVLFSGSGFLQVYTVLISVARRVCPVEFFPSRTILIFFGMTAAGGMAIWDPAHLHGAAIFRGHPPRLGIEVGCAPAAIYLRRHLCRGQQRRPACPPGSVYLIGALLEDIDNTLGRPYILVIVAGVLVTLLSLLIRRGRLFINAADRGV